MSKYRMFVDPERRPANFDNSYVSIDELPNGATQHVIGITASDGAASVGVLHRPAHATKICCVYMHPRTNQTRPYLAPAFLDAGYAVWGQMSRYVNNDVDMTHEEVLLDLAAGLRYLKEQGFEVLIGIGNSGGSSLLAYYQAQASTEPAKRLLQSPAGELTGFASEQMPTFNLYVALALHIGQGANMLRMLDPAVVDESNPIATNAALDMYDPRNGYRDFPQASTYDPEWLNRYRTAQVERCQRLDAIAHSLLQDYHEAREVAVNDPANIASATARRAMYSRYMIVHRTWANPADLDPSIMPSRRPLGALGNEHPVRANLGYCGMARVLTPRAWLSTWSGLCSQARLLLNIPQIKVPTLLVWPDADVVSYRDDVDALVAASGADDVSLEITEWATHYLTPAPGCPADLAPPKQRAGECVVAWIKSRL